MNGSGRVKLMQGGRRRGWEAASWEEKLSNGSVKETFFKGIDFINFRWGGAHSERRMAKMR